MGAEVLDIVIRRLKAVAGKQMERFVEKAADQNADLMGDLNRQQLNQGIRSDHVPLPPYRPKTVKIKILKGQQTKPMNLRDTGGFQDHLKPKKFEGFYEMQSDDALEEKLIDRFGEEIEGLTEENVQVVSEACLPIIYDLTKKYLRI